MNLARLKQRLKTVRGRLREGYVRRFRSFTQADLLAMLRKLGVAPGDIVMAHSSFDKFVGFQGSPIDAIKVLKDAVTPEGTLLMVTLPFTGSASDYVKKGEITDLRKTPSRMGLITEFFRRMGGVERSIHPTHPVAAWGRLAVQMTEGHERAKTPCGVPSPFSKLADENGKILLLGTGARTITFFHYVEEVIEHLMPQSAFTKEEFTLQTRTKTGELVTTVTRLYDQGLALRRWLVPAENELRRRGQWKVGRVKGLVATLIGARDFQKVQTDLAEKGIFFYSEKPRAGAAADPE